MEASGQSQPQPEHDVMVGSWHTRQCFAKPLYTPRSWSPIPFTLPPCVICYHKPVSQCDHQWAILDFHSLPSSAVSPNQDGECTISCFSRKMLVLVSSAFAFNSVVSPIVLGLGQATDTFPIERQIQSISSSFQFRSLLFLQCLVSNPTICLLF